MPSQKDNFSALVYNIISQAETGQAYPLALGQTDDDIEYIGFTIVICNNPEVSYYAYEYDTHNNYDFLKISCPETDKMMETFAKTANTDEDWDVCIVTITEDIDDTIVDFLYGYDSTPWLKPMLALGEFVRPDNNMEKDEAWNKRVVSVYRGELPETPTASKVQTKQVRVKKEPKEVHKRELKAPTGSGKMGWIEWLNQPIELPLLKNSQKVVSIAGTESIVGSGTKTPTKAPAVKTANKTKKVDSASSIIVKDSSVSAMAIDDTSAQTTKGRTNTAEKESSSNTKVKTKKVTPVRDVVYDDYPDEDYRASSVHVEEVIVESEVIVPIDEDVDIEAKVPAVVEPKVDPLPVVAHQSHMELIEKREPYVSVALVICLAPPIVTTYGFWYNDKEDNHGYWTPESKPLDDAIDAFLIDTIPDPKNHWDVCVIRIPSRGAKPKAEFITGEKAKPWLDRLSNRSKDIMQLAKP